jgi:uncharacterized protein
MNEQIFSTNIEIQKKPWGFWSTILFGIGFLAFFCIIIYCSFMLSYFYQKTSNPNMDYFQFLDIYMKSYGFYFVLGDYAHSILGLLFILILIKLKGRILIKEYLNFKKAQFKSYFKWLNLVFWIKILAILIVVAAKHELVDQDTLKTLSTCSFHPAYYFAFFILSPIYEEILYRGFLYKGLRDSKAGKWGAIMITSFLFTLNHLGMSITIFLIGVFLGLAREKTNTIKVPICMHILFNFITAVLIYHHLHFK